ncbi:MAG: hypothetical protein LBT32_02725 [Peptococcaceae bacterium]|jgi:pyrrolysyl-tRNA synthetase-like protein|nr:hypothetical protein [Peptococcaceae bacterium]
MTEKKMLKRYVRKQQSLFALLDKIKLWPSRSGRLHGIFSIEKNGDLAIITTHCQERFVVRDSRNSRGARWLRNRWHTQACPACAVPAWKLEKYLATVFSTTRER